MQITNADPPKRKPINVLCLDAKLQGFFDTKRTQSFANVQ